jgi:hypothetical protein
VAARKSSLQKTFDRFSDRLATYEAPVDVRQYAALRVIFGFLSCWYFLERMPFAWLYLSSGGWLDNASFQESFSTLFRLPLVFQYWPSLVGLFCVFILAAFGWMLGYWTRWTGIVTWLGLVLIENQNPLMGFPGAELLRLIVLPLLFVPAGGMWSLDSWFFPYQTRRTATPIPLFLIRVQVVMIFLLSGYSKFQSQYWLEGDALVYMLLNPTVSRIPPVWVADLSWFFIPVSAVVSRFWMFFETLFPILIIFPIIRRPVVNFASILILLSLVLFKLSWLPLGLMSLLIAFFKLSEIRQLERKIIAMSEIPDWRWKRVRIANPLFFVRSIGMRYESHSALLQRQLRERAAAEKDQS